MLQFLFEKKLQRSDVTAAGRIVIPKREAEFHLPALDSKEGFWMQLDDMDHKKVWTLKFRYWPNNCSRMYIFENTRDFINYHGLAAGDFMMVFMNDHSKTYLIRGRKESGIHYDDVNNPTDQIGVENIKGSFSKTEGCVSSIEYSSEVADQQYREIFIEPLHYVSKHDRSNSFDSIDFSDALFG